MSKPVDMTRLLEEIIKVGPPGCGAAVAQRGEVLFEGYAGVADLETRRLIGADSCYRIFSMTKVIVCTAAMILFERGKFLLNEPISAYLPEYSHPQVVVTDAGGNQKLVDAKNPLLIKHAFNMAVGMPYPQASSPTGLAMRKVMDELTARYGHYDVLTEARAMATIPLAFEPGTHWLYGYGHDLVAALVQLLSGKSVGQFLKDEIFDPLGMTSTAYQFRGDAAQRMVTMYRQAADGTLTQEPGLFDRFHAPEAKYQSGGAGLYSTVTDYLKFTQMLANGGEANGERIIGRATIDLMRTNHLNETQLQDFHCSYLAGYGYGLGVRTLLSNAGGHVNSTPGEFGWTGGGGTYTFIDPARGLSGVYMHQMQPPMEEYIHHRFRAVANGLAK